MGYYQKIQAVMAGVYRRVYREMDRRNNKPTRARNNRPHPQIVRSDVSWQESMREVCSCS